MRYYCIVLILLVCASVCLAESMEFTDASYTEDVKIYGLDPYLNNNYGGTGELSVYGDGSRRSLLRFTGMDDVPAGQIIDSVVLSLYCTSAATQSVAAYEVLQDWVEGTGALNNYQVGSVCYNYREYNTVSWNTAGCSAGSASASQDGSYDYITTALDVTAITTASARYEWHLGAELWQDIYDGVKQPYGIILRDADNAGAGMVFASSENTTASYRPIWTVYYHSGGPSDEPCDRSSDDLCYDYTHRQDYVPTLTGDPDTVALLIVVVGDDIESDAAWATTDAYLDNDVDTLNRITEEYLNLHCAATISHVGDTYWAEQPYVSIYGSSEQSAFLSQYGITFDSQLVVVVVAGASGTYSTPNIGPSLQGFIMMKRNSPSVHSLAHEVGHIFFLLHTHVGVGEWRDGESATDVIDCDDPCREWPHTYGLSDSATALSGDRCPDTWADPSFTALGVIASETDTLCQDSSFGAVDNENLMSYTMDQLKLTPDQVTIFNCFLRTYFAGWIREAE